LPGQERYGEGYLLKNYLIKYLNKIGRHINPIHHARLTQQEEAMDEVKILHARHLLELRKIYPPQDIHSAEFKVFSQWGEDGIIQWILSRVPNITPTFIEFGIENYRESNTRFLLMHNNWKGLVIDASNSCIADLMSRNLYWKYNLTAINSFIDKDNVNDLFASNAFTGEIGILSIDIDGNDYWVWEAIECVSPQIVICEYNSVFGSKEAVVIPYEHCFSRKQAHYTCLYFGASLKALELLAKRKGYVLIGSNSAGSNAFFVREEYKSFFTVQDTVEAYVTSQFRESRNLRGQLTYLSGDDRLRAIREMPLQNLKNGKMQAISEIYGV
jgi:hypothetical protein